MLGGLDFRALPAQIKRLLFAALPEYVIVGNGTGNQLGELDAALAALSVGGTLRICPRPTSSRHQR